MFADDNLVTPIVGRTRGYRRHRGTRALWRLLT
jgi:hypothetical protein